jgi:hypothetical protein
MGMADDFDRAFQLLPPDDELTLDDDLEAARQAMEGDFGPDDEPGPRPFGRGWAFDFATNQFRRGGAAPLEVRGLDQLRMWIETTLRTARLAHPIFSEDYGTDQPFEAIGQVFTPGLAGRYSRAITEALVAHDRITDVKDFNFTGSPTSAVLFVDFTVVTDEAEELPITDLPAGRPF